MRHSFFQHWSLEEHRLLRQQAGPEGPPPAEMPADRRWYLQWNAVQRLEEQVRGRVNQAQQNYDKVWQDVLSAEITQMAQGITRITHNPNTLPQQYQGRVGAYINDWIIHSNDVLRALLPRNSINYRVILQDGNLCLYRDATRVQSLPVTLPPGMTPGATEVQVKQETAKKQEEMKKKEEQVKKEGGEKEEQAKKKVGEEEVKKKEDDAEAKSKAEAAEKKQLADKEMAEWQSLQKRIKTLNNNYQFVDIRLPISDPPYLTIRPSGGLIPREEMQKRLRDFLPEAFTNTENAQLFGATYDSYAAINAFLTAFEKFLAEQMKQGQEEQKKQQLQKNEKLMKQVGQKQQAEQKAEKERMQYLRSLCTDENQCVPDTLEGLRMQSRNSLPTVHRYRLLALLGYEPDVHIAINQQGRITNMYVQRRDGSMWLPPASLQQAFKNYVGQEATAGNLNAMRDALMNNVLPGLVEGDPVVNACGDGILFRPSYELNAHSVFSFIDAIPNQQAVKILRERTGRPFPFLQIEIRADGSIGQVIIPRNDNTPWVPPESVQKLIKANQGWAVATTPEMLEEFRRRLVNALIAALVPDSW